jgi:hypothetical protein
VAKPCPECGGSMEKVTDGYISEPVITGHGKVERKIRLGAYWACGSCEHCEEVTRG